jgi:proteasome lid subunit RPN8/RPN11|tara:strand:+ start:87 stop:569 length:483 start_codon:yes stop_codon:yes gene_type:complete
MISIPQKFLKTIIDAAETAYPKECCGLLIGCDNGAGALVVSRVAMSENIAKGAELDQFEIDPQVRFNVMRELDNNAKNNEPKQRIIGHYHSHPNHPAQPSKTDLEMAYEPDLIWLITSVVDGQATLTTAHCIDADGAQFRQIPLKTTDWHPYDTRQIPTR